MKKTVRTRFAPSPTGFLHIGGLRTALYSYLWAKKHNGTFILRIEDTDQQRLVPGAIEQVVRSLQWAGVLPDEGVVDVKDGHPIEKGDCGPYVQSQRIDLYTKFAHKLLEEKKAYYCFCTSERLEEMRKIQMLSKQMPMYDRTCYRLSAAEAEAKRKEGIPSVLRFFVPDGGAVSWDDAVFGKLSFERAQIDDFIMIKADGFPTYNFANVVDDHTMAITHVIRAQEFLSSTPKHLLLYEAFGVEKPVYAHTSHILGKDKKKLSKRHAAVSVGEYQKMGYLPQALLNFVSLLGWTHPKQVEIFDLQEMIKSFEITAMHKAGAVFDVEKSLWMNGMYIRNLSLDAFTDAVLPFLTESGLLKEDGQGQFLNTLAGNNLSKKQVQAMLATEKQRMKRLSDAPEAIRYYLEPALSYNPASLVWKKMEPKQLPSVLSDVITTLSALPEADWTGERIQAALQKLVETSKRGVGDVFWPTRVALTGKEQSPSPHEVAEVLGKEETLKRLRFANDLVNKDA